MTLIGLLRTRGPMTATQAGKLTGESSGTCSFHFRQLAKYGLVEEAGGGTGREKPWRATAMFTNVADDASDPAAAAAGGLVRSVLADMYFERVARWLESRDSEPEQWRSAALFSDWPLWVTAEELAELGTRIAELISPYYPGRAERPGSRPAGARQVSVMLLGVPSGETRPGPSR